jgi:hypothetical protein
MADGEEGVFLVLRGLFRLFVAEKGLTPAQEIDTNPEEFMTWVRSSAEIGLGPFDNGGIDFIEELGVDEEALEAVMGIAENPMGFLRLMPIWHALVLSRRPPPEHPLESFQLMCLLRWRDGRATPLVVFAPGFLASDGFTDASISGLLLTQSQELMRHIIGDGLDGLHDDKSEQYGDAATLKEFTSMLQACVAELPEERRAPCLNYLRLFSAVVNPPVPAELQAQIKQMSSQIRQEVESEAAEELRGGWDG